MIRSYFKYILKLYSKNLIMMLLGIILSIVAIDYLDGSSKIIGSSNLKVLYVYYSLQYRLAQFYPLAIVFAATVTYMSLVQNNILVSMLSFGYTKRQLFIPFILPAFALYILMVWLQTGEFSYAKERAWSIRHNVQSEHVIDDIFFKHGNSFVYIKKLDPSQRVIRGVTIFETQDFRVMQAIIIDKAYYDDSYWISNSASVMTKNFSNTSTLIGYNRQDVKEYKFLKDYQPKVIELIYEGESLSLVDAVNTYNVLKNQGLNTSQIKAAFYNKAILPLFFFSMLCMLFFKTSFYSRYMNRELIWGLLLGGTLLVWGLFYALYRMSVSGVLSPDIAIAMPIVLLLIYGLSLYIIGEKKLI